MTQTTIRCRYTKPEGSAPGRRAGTSTACRWLDAISIGALLVMMAAAAVFLWTSQARAQTLVCYPFAAMRDALKDRYSEIAIGGGVATGEKAIIQVYASENGATFTILAINTTGMSCIIGAGRDWQPGKLAEKGEPS